MDLRRPPCSSSVLRRLRPLGAPNPHRSDGPSAAGVGRPLPRAGYSLSSSLPRATATSWPPAAIPVLAEAILVTSAFWCRVHRRCPCRGSPSPPMLSQVPMRHRLPSIAAVDAGQRTGCSSPLSSASSTRRGHTPRSGMMRRLVPTWPPLPRPRM